MKNLVVLIVGLLALSAWAQCPASTTVPGIQSGKARLIQP